jgi:2',3'-cyclic-nucleotide 2'-phosphodiesterase (5'-nucleotidase family)
LARRASAIKKLRDQRHGTVIVDSGDALLAGLPRGGKPQKGDLNKAETILRGQGLIGLDAMALGEVDLAVGIRRLRKLGRQTSQTLLCANLVDGRGRAPFPPRKLVTTGEVKVGLTAVLEPPARDVRAKKSLRNARLTIKDPVAAARAQVKALRAAGAELLVLMAHVGMERAKVLAREVEGVHLIVVGHSGHRLATPSREGKTLLVESGRRGQSLGHVQLRLGPGWTADGSLEDDSRRHVLYDEVTKEIEKMAKARPSTDQDPRLIRARALADRLQKLQPPPSKHTLIARLVFLDETVPDDPALKGLVDAARPSWRVAPPPNRRPRGKIRMKPLRGVPVRAGTRLK